MALRLLSNQDVLNELEQFAQQHDIQAAYILMCVGIPSSEFCGLSISWSGQHSKESLKLLCSGQTRFRRELDPMTGYDELMIDAAPTTFPTKHAAAG